jgi:histidinol-phosphate aminotransferase
MAAMSIRAAVRAVPGYRFTPRPHRVKLDQNEGPYDLPEPLQARVYERLREASLNRYPDLHADRVRARVAALEAWPEEGVVVAGGSNVLIQALVIAAGIGRRVLTVTPTFAVYALQAQLLGADLTEVPLGEDAALPTTALLHELSSGGGVHFVADPMAPTGNGVGAEALARLAAAAGDRWLTVVDEAYGAFAGSDHRPLVRREPQAISMRTLSKAYGLGGVRLGYLLAQPDIAREVQKVVLPFSVSSLQLAVVETVLEEPQFVDARVREAVAERQRVAETLAGLPQVHVFPSVANFLLLRVPDAAHVYEALLAHGVLVRRQDHLPGLSGCLRVSIGTPSENDAFLEAMALVPGLATTEREAPRAAG